MSQKRNIIITINDWIINHTEELKIFRRWFRKPEFWIGVISILIAVYSLVISVSVANSTMEAANQIARVNLYLDLKNRYEEINSKLPRKSERDSKGYTSRLKKNDKDWITFERYWQHSFSEWFVTTQLKISHNSKSELWDVYYRDAIKDAAYQPGFQKVLCFLINGGSNFAGKREKFKISLNKLTKDKPISCLTNKMSTSLVLNKN